MLTYAGMGLWAAVAGIVSVVCSGRQPGNMRGRGKRSHSANATAVARARVTARWFNTWSSLGYAIRWSHAMYLLVCIATFEELRASKAGGAFDPLAWVALVTVIIGVPLCSLVALARMTEDDYEGERTQQLWNAAVREVKYEGRLWSLVKLADTAASAAVVVFMGDYPVMQVMIMLAKQFLYVTCVCVCVCGNARGEACVTDTPCSQVRRSSRAREAVS